MIKGIEEKLIDHFAGNRTAAYVAAGLFAAGVLVYIINSAIQLSHPFDSFRILRTVLKAETGLCWVAAAVLGTEYYPTKRNRLLIRTLIFYMLGDIAVMYSYPAGAVLYCFGHLILMWAILETSYIHKWQIAAVILSILGSIILLLHFLDDPALIIAGELYSVIFLTMMVFSLTNRFFWLSGIVFAVSDITGLLRLSLANNVYTYFITNTIYTAAFLMLCISVYSTNRKEVVTLYDLFSMLNDSKSMEVSFWVCGSWALGLISGDRRFTYDRIDLAYDVDHVDEFLAWIKHARYEGKHRYSEGVRSYYSERYGELRIYPCLFEPDGSAVLAMENGHQHKLDKGFFEEVNVFGNTIPCIAPGGAELIRELL